MIERSALPLPRTSTDRVSSAVGTAMNRRGWIAGHVQNCGGGDGEPTFHATVWTPTGVVDLGTLPPGEPGQRSFAEDIDDDGTVVGWGTTLDADGMGCSRVRALIWSAAAGMRPLPLLTDRADALARASAINGAGTVAGTATDDDGVQRPVLWSSPDAEPIDLGFPGRAFAINDHGDVVGSTGGAGFVWNAATGPRLLSIPGSAAAAARAINADGLVVGAAVSPTGTCRPFLWSPGGHMRLLGMPPGAVSAVACAISDRGVIGVNADVPDPVTGLVRSRPFLCVDGAWIDLEPHDGGESRIVADVDDALCACGFGADIPAGTLTALRWEVKLPPGVARRILPLPPEFRRAAG